MTDPWENPDGSTNVEGYLAACAADSNTPWRAGQGHMVNVIDTLLDQRDQAVKIGMRLTEEIDRQQAAIRWFVAITGTNLTLRADGIWWVGIANGEYGVPLKPEDNHYAELIASILTSRQP